MDDKNIRDIRRLCIEITFDATEFDDYSGQYKNLTKAIDKFKREYGSGNVGDYWSMGDKGWTIDCNTKYPLSELNIIKNGDNE